MNKMQPMEPMKPMQGMAPMQPMQPMKPMEPMQPMAQSGSNWWPSGLADPSSSGAQNGMSYAFFPQKRRLVVKRGDQVTQYDAGNHQISGVSQSQGSGDEGIKFSSQQGDVDLASLSKTS